MKFRVASFPRNEFGDVDGTHSVEGALEATMAAMNEKSATETSEWLYEAVIRFLQVRIIRHRAPPAAEPTASPLFPPCRETDVPSRR